MTGSLNVCVCVCADWSYGNFKKLIRSSYFCPTLDRHLFFLFFLLSMNINPFTLLQ